MPCRNTILSTALLLIFSTLGFGQQLISSVSKGAVPLEELVNRYGNFMSNGVELYKITYTTVDLEGRPDTASGLIVFPDLDNRILPLLCYQHGTVGSRDDVPSNLRGGYEIAEVFGGLGYVSVAPDYLGLGESRGIHPYVHADSEAWVAVDMLFAAREFAAQKGVPLNDQLFVTGYSQGGHAAAALHRDIQHNYADDFIVTASAPMSGPYNISGVMRDLILSEEEYFFPSYLPYTILSYNAVYGLYDDLNAILKEPYSSMVNRFVEEEINLSELNTALIDTLTGRAGGSFTSAMLQDSVIQNFTGNPSHPINVALEDNDVYDWAPQAPARLYYCVGDDQVPFRNSVVADSVMNENGAPDVGSVNLGDMLDHGECVEPAVINGALFFGLFQNIETTSIGQIADTRVAAYPNPVRELLRVEAPEGAYLELADLNGRILLRGEVNGGQSSLNTGPLPKGIYLLRVRTRAGSWSGKVVKE